jgi:hypothetical protein
MKGRRDGDGKWLGRMNGSGIGSGNREEKAEMIGEVKGKLKGM